MNALVTYIETIKILQKAKIKFVLTGTFALYLQHKKFADHYPIKDCDIFVKYTEDNLSLFASVMQQQQWTVKIWEQEIDLSNLIQQAEGKYYIRCTKEELILDATYEHEAAIFGDPEKDLIYVNNIPVIAADKIIKGKAHRGTEKDKQAVACFELLANGF